MNKKMKIIFFITGLNAGGAENQLYRIISNLDKNKYEIKIISLMDKGKIGEKFINDNVHLYEIKINKRGNKIKGSINLYSILKKEKPDILVCFLYHAIIIGRILGKILGVPYIISSIRNIKSGGLIRDKIMKYTDSLSNVTTTNSHLAAEVLVKDKITKSSRMKVITNGIEVDKFKFNENIRSTLRKSMKIEDDEFIWVAVGRLEPQKNYPLLLNSLSDIVKKVDKVKLFIVGEGKLREELENLCHKLEINKNVTFMGIRSDVCELLNIADGFVMSSKWEGMPNVIMEAQALERVVVSTNVGGVSELVINSKTGFLVNTDKELSKIMLEVMTMDNDYKNNIQSNAREHIINNFSMQNIIRQWEELFSLSSGI